MKYFVKTFCNICVIKTFNFCLYALPQFLYKFQLRLLFSLCLIQHTDSVYAEGPAANVFSQPAGPNLRPPMTRLFRFQFHGYLKNTRYLPHFTHIHDNTFIHTFTQHTFISTHMSTQNTNISRQYVWVWHFLLT